MYDKPVLEVRNLTTAFEMDDGIAYVVNDVSFTLYEGETLGLVGESGCGKTVTALSILGLVRPPGKIISGEVLLNGENLFDKTDRQLRDLRGDSISMIFQEPMTSLNPVFRIGDQIVEVLVYHKKMSWSEARIRTLKMLERVGIPDPPAVMDAYPHQLSGGMRQRILIAMSLITNPKVVIADEPTTAIDVTVQSQVLNLINDLKNEFGMAVLLISHDLGVVAQTCDRVAIMYASHIVEHGMVRDIFYRSHHPYSVGLLQAIPSFHKPKEKLNIIPGQVPRPTHYPRGCNFQSRCDYATENCVTHEPRLEQIDGKHHVSCWNWKFLHDEQTPLGYA